MFQTECQSHDHHSTTAHHVRAGLCVTRLLGKTILIIPYASQARLCSSGSTFIWMRLKQAAGDYSLYKQFALDRQQQHQHRALCHLQRVSHPGTGQQPANRDHMRPVNARTPPPLKVQRASAMCTAQIWASTFVHSRMRVPDSGVLPPLNRNVFHLNTHTKFRNVWVCDLHKLTRGFSVFNAGVDYYEMYVVQTQAQAQWISFHRKTACTEKFCREWHLKCESTSPVRGAPTARYSIYKHF